MEVATMGATQVWIFDIYSDRFVAYANSELRFLLLEVVHVITIAKSPSECGMRSLSRGSCHYFRLIRRICGVQG